MSKGRPESIVGGNDLLFSGLMMKQGSLFKNWRLRWFELTPTHIFYFKCVVGSSAELKGTIKLSDVVRIVRGNEEIGHLSKKSVKWPTKQYPPASKPKTTIAIVTKKRTYYTVAPDRLHAKKWEKAINAIIHPHGTSEQSHTFVADEEDDDVDPYADRQRRQTVMKTGIDEELANDIREQEALINNNNEDDDDEEEGEAKTK
eukprot:m.10651 g.10651  ORF g.10651 m.10651 type:complete len:202 (-) comp6656_c0_seq1:305-910(-)